MNIVFSYIVYFVHYKIAQCVCFTGSHELGIDGCKLALEESGFLIGSDYVLKSELEKGNVLILLCAGENWKPAGGIYILTRRELSRL